MREKLLIPCLYLEQNKAVNGWKDAASFEDGDAVRLARYYSDHGADQLLVYDLSSDDISHEESILLLREICQTAEIPVLAGGNVRRQEDIKKLLYAGCQFAVLNFSKPENVALLRDVSERFGRERILVSIGEPEEFEDHRALIDQYAGGILSMPAMGLYAYKTASMLPVIRHMESKREADALDLLTQSDAICGDFLSSTDTDLCAFKELCQERGIPVKVYLSRIPWEQFKQNSDGLVPVIVQDYQTDEVLMLAYMNETAYEETLKTGKMTYWSRSRQELWVKGLTSGHFQYVKSLYLDCDNDTILAKVDQIGAACHTGSRSCFFQELMKRDYHDSNPLHVFQDVYDVIVDRKEHPKEGSYTNYLFDKGMDKILKKVGEECTEIVIAAKNPDKEEVKYEIADFLYHVMVLMVEKGLTWEEVTDELSNRS